MLPVATKQMWLNICSILCMPTGLDCTVHALLLETLDSISVGTGRCVARGTPFLAKKPLLLVTTWMASCLQRVFRKSCSYSSDCGCCSWNLFPISWIFIRRLTWGGGHLSQTMTQRQKRTGGKSLSQSNLQQLSALCVQRYAKLHLLLTICDRIKGC